jgi:hypothetical protein
LLNTNIRFHPASYIGAEDQNKYYHTKKYHEAGVPARGDTNLIPTADFYTEYATMWKVGCGSGAYGEPDCK